MRIAVVSLCTPEMVPVGRLTRANRRAYCDRHGYGFFEAAGAVEPGRHPAWSKLPLILDQLGRCDWVFWNDCDSLFTSPEVRLEDLLPELADPAVDLFITRDRYGANAGQFLVSGRSGRAGPFLAAAWGRGNTGDAEDHPLRDQAALTRAIDAGAPPLGVRCVAKRALNADVKDWREGDLLVHFYGQPARAYLIRQWLRRMGQPAPSETPDLGQKPADAAALRSAGCS